MISNETINVLRRWYSAHKIAEENPQLIIEANRKGADECRRVSDLCAARMRECAKADKALHKLTELPADEVPPLVRLFFESGEDKGCSHCWLSSAGPKHPECKFKIGRWFGYREALMAYTYEVYVRHQVQHEEKDSVS